MRYINDGWHCYTPCPAGTFENHRDGQQVCETHEIKCPCHFKPSDEKYSTIVRDGVEVTVIYKECEADPTDPPYNYEYHERQAIVNVSRRINKLDENSWHFWHDLKEDNSFLAEVAYNMAELKFDYPFIFGDNGFGNTIEGTLTLSNQFEFSVHK